jgi:hypothetical protein
LKKRGAEGPKKVKDKKGSRYDNMEKFVEMIQVKESVEVDELIDTCRRVGRQRTRPLSEQARWRGLNRYQLIEAVREVAEKTSQLLKELSSGRRMVDPFRKESSKW